MAADHLTISVVIIARNEEATVRRCIESALGQTVPVQEVIVVDGNSTDFTRRYVSDIERRDSRVRMIVEDPGLVERGPAAARNTGASLASGDFILFMNGDISIAPDYVVSLFAEMDRSDLDAVAGLRWNVRTSLVAGLMNVHYALNYNSRPETVSNPAFLSGDAMLIKADRFWRAGGYDPRMPSGEDVDLGYRLRADGSRIGYCKDAVAWHEGRHHRSFADWVKQVEWYGRGAAALARAHTWRLEREREGLQRHLLTPLSILFAFLLVVVVAGAAWAPSGWALSVTGISIAWVKYLRTAVHVQRRCNSVTLPTLPFPQDVMLYPVFSAVRYGLQSTFTWWALLIADWREQHRQPRDGSL